MFLSKPIAGSMRDVMKLASERKATSAALIKHGVYVRTKVVTALF